ncbi:hypothetical protein [Mycobacterium talmoniae]|nr:MULTISPECIES: hypothetical protein [Mycobacterium]TDH57482.1 hypothetical protein E2F47_01525 [Mycobacterium eburneum]
MVTPWQGPPGQPGWGPNPGPNPYGAPAGNPYGQPANPYGQVGNPYGQAGNPYSPAAGTPYGQAGYPPLGAALQPSGATAITAAILSFLGSLVHGIGALGSLLGLASPLTKYSNVSGGFFALLAVVSGAVAAGLLVGGIMLLRRQFTGRMVIAVSCGAVILMAIASYAFSEHLLRGYGVTGFTSSAVGLLLNTVMPGVTMTLALVGPTRRWCLTKPPSLPAPPPGAW